MTGNSAALVKLDSGTKRWAIAGAVLFGIGGLVAFGTVWAGLDEQTDSQRMGAVLVGLGSVAFAVVAGVALRRPSNTLTIDMSGFVLRQPPHVESSVRWSELSRVFVSREKRYFRSISYWHYRLDWWPDLPEFDARHPELRDFAEGDRYRYELGRLGWNARNLGQGFERFGPHYVDVAWTS